MSKVEATIEMMRDFLRFETEAARVPGLERALADARRERDEVRLMLARMVMGADVWATWEGGFPVGGDIGPAYKAAVAYLKTVAGGAQ